MRKKKMMWVSWAALLAASAWSLGWAPQAQAQRVVSLEVALGSDRARVEVELEDGRSRSVEFGGGRLLLDGQRAATYERGGVLETAWRSFLEGLQEGRPGAAAYSALAAMQVTSGDAEALRAVRGALDGLEWMAPTEPTPAAPPAAATGAQDTIQAPAAPAAPRARRERARGGVVVEIESLADVVDIVEDLGLDLTAQLKDRLERLEPPIKVVAFASLYELPEGDTLEGSLILWDTEGRIAGVVKGDLLVIQKEVRLRPGALIQGDALAIDGSIENEGAEVRGAISEISGVAVLRPLRTLRHVTRPAPVRFVRGAFHNIVSGVQMVLSTVAIYVFFALLGLFAVAFSFLKSKLEMVADTLAASFGRSLLMGLVAEAVFPIALLILTLLFVTIPAIPVYVLAMVLGGLLGYLAVAMAAGANFLAQPAVAERVRWSHPYARLLVGLGLLLGLFVLGGFARMGGRFLGLLGILVLVAAWLLTWMAATAGLGAVVLSRFGTRRDFAGRTPLPAAAPVSAGPTPATGPEGSAGA
ncbi:MAG: hypothetical protein HY702_08260 [Gemmatimonadetes bacterium]|nr:hypothetical protein [Gemmatimonadota bacterium]